MKSLHMGVTRVVNGGACRPRLGSPDAAAELQALVETERARCKEVQSAIQQFKKSVLQSETQGVKQFAARLNGAVKALLAIIDSLVYADDLGQSTEVRSFIN
jgi:molecular chaperone GrpE (heat shock protein)